jgi:hypothetical protein
MGKKNNGRSKEGKGHSDPELNHFRFRRGFLADFWIPLVEGIGCARNTFRNASSKRNPGTRKSMAFGILAKIYENGRKSKRKLPPPTGLTSRVMSYRFVAGSALAT